MKFAKYLEATADDLSNYINYKALKRLIKTEKASFYTRLSQEIEKVNEYYGKEESQILTQFANLSSTTTLTNCLKERVEHLISYIQLNQTAIYKILKKFDKHNKGRTQICITLAFRYKLADCLLMTSLRERLRVKRGDVTETTNDQVEEIRAAQYDLKPNCLISAAQGGYIEALSDLISLGFDINVTDEAGWTPLFHALSNDHYDCFLKLLDTEGCNLSITDRKDWTCRDYCSYRGLYKMMEQIDLRDPPVTLSDLELSKNEIELPILALPPPSIPIQMQNIDFLLSLSIISVKSSRGSNNADCKELKTSFGSSRYIITDLTNLPSDLSSNFDTLESLTISFEISTLDAVSKAFVFAHQLGECNGRTMTITTQDSRMAPSFDITFQSNLILPFEPILDLIAIQQEIVELKVHQLLDGALILSQRDSVSVAGLDFPLSCIAYEQALKLFSPLEPMSRTNSKDISKSLYNGLELLEDALRSIPTHIGISLLISSDNSRQEELIQSILQMCYQSPHPFIFTSYSPSIAQHLRHKQRNAVYLIAGPQGLPIKQALKFVSSKKLDGLIIDASSGERVVSYVRKKLNVVLAQKNKKGWQDQEGLTCF